jgi:electron transport complex protein RnfG
MAKMESTLKNMVLSLTLISLSASALLAGGYVLTKEPIEKAAQDKKNNAIKEVLPKGDITIGEAVEIKLDGYEDAFVIYPAKQGDEIVACAIETYDNNGYGGKIKTMVGLDKEGKVVNYSILEMNETPGLGAKAGEWFKEKGDIRGKLPSDESFKVRKDGGEIDAITASTITSRAFIESIKAAHKAYLKYQQK